MNWTDDGIVLSARKHGETSLIVTLLTAVHGAHSGLVRGGAGKRARGIYEAGNFVTADWRARLEDHLGAYICELTSPNAAPVLGDALKLAGLSSACAVTERALPEREPMPEIFASLHALIEALEDDNWISRYVAWELDLLTQLGFGLDLTACAATGTSDNLVYVSPKSGQAVSEDAGRPYHDRMLPLPKFLKSLELQEDVRAEELVKGLELTGYFLDRHAFIHHKTGAPSARTRLVDRVKQLATISGS
jgi:DNA repair protein RecO (recombination protein O)